MFKNKKIPILVSLFMVGILIYLNFDKKYNIPYLPPLENSEISLNQEKYLEDFEYMYSTLEECYPFFEVNTELNGLNFLKYHDLYREKIKNCKNDKDFEIEISKILNELYNNHTNLVKKDFAYMAYITYYNLPKEDWRHKMSEVFKNENVRKRYDITTESLKQFNEKSFIDNTSKQNVEVGDIIPNKIGYISIDRFISADSENKNFLIDKKTILNYLKNTTNYNALIIDIRGNGGGDSNYWIKFLMPELLNESQFTYEYSFMKDGHLFKNIISSMNKVENLADFNFSDNTKKYLKDFQYYRKTLTEVQPKENGVEFNGSLYLLVDKKVYSSSEKFASFCKETGCATLIGKKTSGDGIGNDPFIFNLPNSGFLIRFPKEMGVTESGSINELEKTSPDYEVNATKNIIFTKNSVDYSKDECIKKVLELEKNK